MSLLKIQEPRRVSIETSKRSLNQRLHKDGFIRSSADSGLSSPDFLHWPIWELAFRSGFLLASLLSVISLVVWALFLNGIDVGVVVKLNGQGLSPIVWHIHEMIFGFAAAVAMAFLLTAVQTWTGRRSLHGIGLILMVLLWLSGRVFLWGGDGDWQWLAVLSQAAWWLLGIAAFSRLVINSRSRRNYIFIPVLVVMMAINITILLADLYHRADIAVHLAHTAVLVFGLLVGIVGGRVIPFFTERATQLGNESVLWLNHSILIVSTIGIVIFVSSFWLTQYFSILFSSAHTIGVSSGVLIATGLLHAVRLLFWLGCIPGRKNNLRNILRNPLLWSLYGAYGFLSLGLMVSGVSYLLENIALSRGLHLITLGTIGAMILSMMARVSLGHTGRPLIVHPLITISFGLVFGAVVIRFLFPFLWGMSVSIVLWVIAFSIFLMIYTPVLCRSHQR